MTEPGQDDPEPLSLKLRLQAWWEGYDPSLLVQRRRQGDASPSPRTGSGPEGEPRRAGFDRLGKPLWTASRLQVAEKIWGDDFISPGFSDYLSHLLTVLGLTRAMSVIELSAGLGGVARFMAKKYGAWVLGLEASPLLREEGLKRSAKAGLSKQAMIAPYDPEKFSYPKRVDVVFAKECLYTVENKDGLFDAVAACLKPGGQFLFTDYCLTSADEQSEALAAWGDREPQEPVLWTASRIADAMRSRAFDLRVVEDITHEHRAGIKKCIQAFCEHLEKHLLDESTKKNVLDEVELWAFRTQALESGLRCYRFHALKSLF